MPEKQNGRNRRQEPAKSGSTLAKRNLAEPGISFLIRATDSEKLKPPHPPQQAKRRGKQPNDGGDKDYGHNSYIINDR